MREYQGQDFGSVVMDYTRDPNKTYTRARTHKPKGVFGREKNITVGCVRFFTPMCGNDTYYTNNNTDIHAINTIDTENTNASWASSKTYEPESA